MDNDCKEIAANVLSRKSTGGSGKDKQAPKSPLQMPMVVAAAKKARTKVKSGTSNSKKKKQINDSILVVVEGASREGT